MSIDSEKTNSAEQKALEIITQCVKAIEFEQEHQYINAVGHSGDFSSFIRKKAKDALRIFPQSTKWNLCFTLMERYPFLDLATRMSIIKKILDNLKDLQEHYRNEINTQNYFTEANSNLPKVEVKQKKTSIKTKEIFDDIDISKLDIQFVKGVGPYLADKLRHVGIETCEDLLNYFPRDHIAYSDVTPIAELENDTDASVIAFIHKVSAFKTNKGLIILSLYLKDSTGQLKVNYYFKGNSTHYYLKQYKGLYPTGSTVLAMGRVKPDKYTKSKTLANPTVEIISDDISESKQLGSNQAGRIIPIYPLTEGLSLKLLRRLIQQSLVSYDPCIKEFIPKDIIERYNFLDYKNSILNIHFPQSLEAKDLAVERLVFNDFFLMQLRFMQIRHEHKTKYKGIEFNCFENGLVDKFLDILPFELTFAQRRVFFNEILPDLVSKEPMHRLLQGDVGSGKTVVAFLTLLVAVQDGYQAAIMAPTEILAEQHYKKFCEWAQKLDANLNIGLLIGKQKAKEKRLALEKLANGETNIAVGTHALIQKAVEFNKLGLVVIDEQHRFGVKQREMLAQKANQINQTTDHQLSLMAANKEAQEELDSTYGKSVEKLFMTATPIPRTLALALHGDLDMSEIDEMPEGRLPIITEIISKKAQAHNLIKSEIEKGNQAYIVFPLIEESEALSAKAATVEYEKLKEGIFKNYNLALIHGKLKDDEKEQVMLDFRNKKIDILVSTTVIEVGVDVPDATVILIESADRFGLAQLHQLRGRVGRNNKQSYCLLSTESKSQTTRTRLGIMTRTNNGFILAQEDLKLRGAGDITGLKQSGVPESVLQGMSNQEEILELARKEARELIDQDPELEDHKVLKSRLDIARWNLNLNAG